MRWVAALGLVCAASLPSTARADSVSCGSANRGALADAAELPVEGDGFVIPEPWRSRDLRFGTDELIALIERAAKTVAAAHPGAVLGVADLSREHGGASRGHQSHQSGRDVDFHYYALDEQGEPMAPDEFLAYYSRSGHAHYAHSPVWTRHIPERTFDTERNWALVKVLLEDQDTTVERIFVSARIKRWLLRYARQIGEDEELIHRAQRVLHRPRDAEPHNDHMHVRIACSQDDIAMGRCRANARRPKHGKWHRRIRCPRVVPQS